MTPDELFPGGPGDKEWRCFHCDFVTRDCREARKHFGERDTPKVHCRTCIGKIEAKINTLQQKIKKWRVW